MSKAVLSFTSVTLVSKGLVVDLRCSKASGKALWRCYNGHFRSVVQEMVAAIPPDITSPSEWKSPFHDRDICI